MSTRKRKASPSNINNNENNTPYIPRFPLQNPPSTIKRRIHQKQQELRKEYPTNRINLQHLETVPPPKNKNALFKTHTYRFGSIMHPELQYNMLHTYPNPNYITPIQSPIHTVSPARQTTKQSPKKNNNKSQKAFNDYMKYINAFQRRHTSKNK